MCEACGLSGVSNIVCPFAEPEEDQVSARTHALTHVKYTLSNTERQARSEGTTTGHHATESTETVIDEVRSRRTPCAGHSSPKPQKSQPENATTQLSI